MKITMKFKRVKITELRMRHKGGGDPVNQGELAAKSGIHQTTLSRLDNGRVFDVNLSTLIAIMNAFGLPANTPLSDLVEFEEVLSDGNN